MKKRIVLTISVEAEEGNFPDKHEIATAISGVLQNKAGDPFQWGDATVYDNVQDLLLDAAECAEGLDLPSPLVVPFSMPIENGDEEGRMDGRIEIGPLGFEVYIEGFGVQEMDPDFGSVLYLNHYEGSPQVVVHGDILQPDPTHVIQLATAAEERRETAGREPLFESQASPNLGGYRSVRHTFKPNDAHGS